LSSPNGYSSVTVILSGRRDKVEVEKEVIKTTLNAACTGFRISTRNVSYPTQVVAFLEKVISGNKLFSGFRIWDSRGFDLVLPRYYPYPITKDFESEGELSVYGKETLIKIGYSLDSNEPRSVFLTYNDIFNRIGIFGSTGTGKSTTAALIITALSASEIKNRFKIAVIDWHSEYEKMLTSMGSRKYKVIDFSREDFRLGLFCYPRMGHESVAELLSEALSLSDPQAVLLTRVIHEQRPTSVSKLIERLEDSLSEGYWSREIRHAILRKLYVIHRSRYGALFSTPCGNLEELMENSQEDILIFDMFKIKNTTLRRLIAYAILSNLYYIAREKNTNIILLLDEAQNLISGSSSSLVNSIVVEGRKFGLGLILSTQNPSMLPGEILSNLNTKIIHAIRSGIDKRIIEESMSLTHEYIQILDKLGKGEALVQSHLYKKPVLVRIDPFQYVKQSQ
jgi:DNA helicase HerA-like ATPase